MENRRKANTGSALLVTLLLVSLMMVLVLAFTVHVRMELRAVQNRMHRAQARHNARLALNLALNQLQIAAGPDQRVTARAEILGDAVSGEKRYWTGVWTVGPSGEVSASPIWMISGTSPSPTSPVPNAGISMYPASGSHPALHAEPEGILDPQGRKTGELAYWISDEGVKVSVGKVDSELQPGLRAEARGLTEAQMQRLPQLTPGRTRNELLFPSFPWDQKRSAVEQAVNWRQLALTGLDASALESRRHLATWKAFGVISDTEHGGLRRDLSYSGPSTRPDAFAESTGLRAWAAHRPDEHREVFWTGVSAPPLPGEPVFSIPLVQTEFGLYMRISRIGNSDALRFQIKVRTELWNASASALAVDPEETEDLIFEITGLPVLHCTWNAGGPAAQPPARGTFAIDPNTLTLRTSANTNFSLSRFPVDLNKTLPLAAGEVYRTTTEAEVPIDVLLNHDPTPVNHDDYVWIKGDESAVTLRIRTGTGDLLQEFVGIPFAAFDTRMRETDNDRLDGIQVSGRTFEDFQLVFHYRMDDETPNGILDQPAPIEAWFTRIDPRTVRMPGEAYHREIEISPVDDAALFSLFQPSPDLFAYGFRYFPAFDIPLAPPVSVGSLQHLQFFRTPPLTVGNPRGRRPDANGVPFNSYFDRYFFSTIPADLQCWDPHSATPLPNSHLVPRAVQHFALSSGGMRDPYCAKNLLVEGAFNLNCVQKPVWQAVLGSLHLQNWDYATGTTAEIRNGIFRLPNGADQSRSYPGVDYPRYPDIDASQKTGWFRDGDNPMWANAYRLGIREITPQELDALCGELTRRMQTRARPFASIRDFADSGILQHAIDATTINSTGGTAYAATGSDQRIPPYAPAFVSQADILQMIAPFLFARSDTFVIRAYGSWAGADGRSTGQFCEAVVQRCSEPVSLSDPSRPAQVEADYISPPGPFGRRFKIVSFSWLEHP